MSRALSRHTNGPPMGDLAALLGEVQWKKQAEDLAVLAVSGATGIFAGRLLKKQVGNRFGLHPLLQAAGVGAIGAATGLFGSRYAPRAATGLAVGLLGEAIGGLVVHFVPALGQVTEEELLLGTGTGQADEAEELTRALLSGGQGARQFDVEGVGEQQERMLEVETTAPSQDRRRVLAAVA